LIGELPIDAPIVLARQCLPLGDRVHVASAGAAIPDRKSPRLIGNFVYQPPMSIGNIESLNQS
jgi:hypothetical protein